jgi:putative selenate reductase
MAELRPIPFEQLLYRVLHEPARQQTLFDLPLRKVWRPRAELDLSVDVHGHRAQSPVGPAAGPHAQLAQNIVLAWAAGARIIELKTVQILDELKIPRPCIDVATVGYNVEWSQELRLADSLREYVAGWMLVRILRELDPLGLGAAAAQSEPVFELSVGYDLAGLKNAQMHNYLMQAQNVRSLIDELRGRIPAEQRRLRDLDYRADLVSCVTLSTFHGCPPAEIEAIAGYLLVEIGVDVIVKLNPTLLGYDEVSHLLRDRLGYHDLVPKRTAFDGDLTWADALGLGQRLQAVASRHGRSFGVKMTNTLVVENHKRWLPGDEMYLSGPPLHVLAMQCVERWRDAFGSAVPLSFSGGIDQHNVVDAVACDFVPVTSCTDLLRAGGYARMTKYLVNVEEAMIACGARTRDELIWRRFDKGDEARRLARAELQSGDGRGDVDETLLCDRTTKIAARLNSRELAARALEDPRYGAAKNGKPPRKVGSTLVLFDCLSCDKCVPVCPNDANFAIDTPPLEVAYEDIVVDGAGVVTRVPGGLFVVGKAQQWANFADACNECGNCDVFCPEDGGPYLVKARFFGSRASFDASPSLDGVLIESDGDGWRVRARVGGRPYALELLADAALLDDGVLQVRYGADGAIVDANARGGGAHRLSGAIYWTLRTLLRGALDGARINSVSAALPGRVWPAAV